MCRSLYRYPDPEAADVAKKTLEEIRPKTASMESKVVQNDLHDVNEQRIDPWPIPNLIQFVSAPAKCCKSSAQALVPVNHQMVLCSAEETQAKISSRMRLFGDNLQ